MNKKNVIDLLRQCKLIMDCVDKSQMPDIDALRISKLVNNIRTIMFCESEVLND